MGRKPLFRTAEHPYHLRARSNNKEWFDLPIDVCFSIFSDVIEATCSRYSLQLHAFVLMSNHFHLTASTPDANIDSVMQFFMSQSSRQLRRGTSRINHIYGGRYKWSVISSPEYYRNCHRYLAQNPVRAKLVGDVRNWEYSTFSKIDSSISRLVRTPEHGHACLLPDADEMIDWLNTPIAEESVKIIRDGLSRPLFSYGRDRDTRVEIKSLL